MPSREQIEQAHRDADWLRKRLQAQQQRVEQGRRTLGHPEGPRSYDWRNFGSRKES